jgi:hypothetical protein
MSIYDKERVVFDVVQEIDSKSGVGIIQDKSKFQFKIRLDSLNPDCDSKTYKGEQLEGLVDGQRIYDLAPYLASSHDRDRVESAGPVEENVGWEPRTGDPRYCLGTPDSGKFSGPLSPESIKTKIAQKRLDIIADKPSASLLPESPRPLPFCGRLVQKSACPDPNDLPEYIRQQTGGQVTMIGVAQEKDDFTWLVECFSSDGKP